MKAFWPKKLSHLQQRELIGAGQYGLVYRVFNPELQKTTVIKLIEVQQENLQNARKRFLREIKSLNRVHSDHIVKMLNSWVEPDFLAFEMEYVPGISLDRLLVPLSRLPYGQKEGFILKVVEQLCQGLADLHRQDLVHRDLKPSNILIQIGDAPAELAPEAVLQELLEQDFLVKITDLGLVRDLSASASITGTKEFIGTAAYVAPEQAKGEKIYPATDLYSLGVVWYELSTGKNPFYQKNILRTIDAHLTLEPPALNLLIPEFPLDLNHIIMLLLQKDPKLRYFTAQRLKSTLEERRKPPEEQQVDLQNLLPPPEAFPLPTQFPCERYFEKVQEYLENRDFLLVIDPDPELLSVCFNFLGEQRSVSEPLKIYFSTRLHTSFLLFLANILLKQLSPTEISEWKEALPEDSLFRDLLSLSQEKDFYRQYAFLNKHFRKIPGLFKSYNWLQFLIELIRLVSVKKAIYFFLDPDYTANPLNNFLLFSLVEYFRDSNVKWILGCDSVSPLLEAEFDSGIIKGEKIPLDSLLDRENYEQLNRFAEQTSCFDPLRLQAEEKRSYRRPEHFHDLSEQEIKFLKYFALVGPENPLGLVNWLINSLFNNKNIVLSLLQKNILRQFLHPIQGRMLGFVRAEDYHYFHRQVPLSEQEEILDRIVQYQEKDPTLFAKERLLDTFMKLGEVSRVVGLATDFLDFYYGLGDLIAHEYILQKVQRFLRAGYSAKKEFDSIRYHQLLNQIVRGEKQQIVDRVEEITRFFSGKYSFERNVILMLIVSLAIRVKNFELAQEYLEKIRRNSNIRPVQLATLEFMEAILEYREGKKENAAAKMSEVLMNFHQLDYVWLMSIGCYTLARILFDLAEYEKSYTYAAMAIQSGRVLNDFRVVHEATELILKNPYYQNKRTELRDWSRVRDQLIKFSIERTNRVDFRFELLEDFDPEEDFTRQ